MLDSDLIVGGERGEVERKVLVWIPLILVTLTLVNRLLVECWTVVVVVWLLRLSLWSCFGD